MIQNLENKMEFLFTDKQPGDKDEKMQEMFNKDLEEIKKKIN